MKTQKQVLLFLLCFSLFSCGKHTTVPMKSEVAHYSGNAGDFVILLPKLTSSKEILDAIAEENIKITGAQYYAVGGSGGINMLAQPKLPVNFFNVVLDGFKGRRDVWENRILSDSKSQDRSIKKMSTDAASYNSALHALNLKEKADYFGNSDLETPYFYAIYIKSTREIADSIGSKLHSKVYKGDKNHLLKIQPDYVTTKYEQEVERYSEFAPQNMNNSRIIEVDEKLKLILDNIKAKHHSRSQEIVSGDIFAPQSTTSLT